MCKSLWKEDMYVWNNEQRNERGLRGISVWRENIGRSNYIRRKVHPGGLEDDGNVWGVEDDDDDDNVCGGIWERGEIEGSEYWGGEEELENGIEIFWNFLGEVYLKV